jgi:hypothetical protein
MNNDENHQRIERNELTKLKDDGINNNFGEWETKSYHKLEEWDLLKYIEGVTPTYAPQLIIVSPYPYAPLYSVDSTDRSPFVPPDRSIPRLPDIPEIPILSSDLPFSLTYAYLPIPDALPTHIQPSS